MFEYGVVDVKESVPERGLCTASALAATALKLSAEFIGSEACGIDRFNGKGVRSVWACAEFDLFFSGELFEREVESLRPRCEPLEREIEAFRRDVDAVELYGCDPECVAGDPLLVLGLVDVVVPENIPPPLKSPPPVDGCALCISPPICSSVPQLICRGGRSVKSLRNASLGSSFNPPLLN
jgi:hypothetical protein